MLSGAKIIKRNLKILKAFEIWKCVGDIVPPYTACVLWTFDLVTSKVVWKMEHA